MEVSGRSIDIDERRIPAKKKGVEVPLNLGFQWRLNWKSFPSAGRRSPFIPTFIGKIFQFPPINGRICCRSPIGREVNSSGGERSLSYPETGDTGGLIRVDPVARKFSFLVGKRGYQMKGVLNL